MKFKKWKIILVVIVIVAAIYYIPHYTKYHLPITIKPTTKQVNEQQIRLKYISKNLFQFCTKNNFNSNYCFVVDMKLHSGKNRFFVYDLKQDSILKSGLVAHGSGNKTFASSPTFSNINGSGCSSLGKYKIGSNYTGRFGKAYKLTGLDSSNSNAFNRFVVLHAYDCVPNSETYPQNICNSLGCPMVSYDFLNSLSKYIDKSNKKVLLFITN